MKRLLAVVPFALLVVAAAPARCADAGPRAISECGAIRKSGHYVLAGDLVAEGTCLRVQAWDVTIDGAGHEITWGTREVGHGIDARRTDGLVVRDLRFRWGGHPLGPGEDAVGLRIDDASGIEARELAFEIDNTNDHGQFVYGIWYETGRPAHDVSFAGIDCRLQGATNSACIWASLSGDTTLSGLTLARITVTADATFVQGDNRPCAICITGRNRSPGISKVRISDASITCAPGEGASSHFQGISTWNVDEGVIERARIVFGDRCQHARAINLDGDSDHWVVDDWHITGDSDAYCIGLRSRYGSDRHLFANGRFDGDGRCIGGYFGGRGDGTPAGSQHPPRGISTRGNRVVTHRPLRFDGYLDGFRSTHDVWAVSPGWPGRDAPEPDWQAAAVTFVPAADGAIEDVVFEDTVLLAPAGARQGRPVILGKGEIRARGVRFVGCTSEGPLRREQVLDFGAQDDWTIEPAPPPADDSPGEE
jgi:hypothetical protein